MNTYLISFVDNSVEKVVCKSYSLVEGNMIEFLDEDDTIILAINNAFIKYIKKTV